MSSKRENQTLRAAHNFQTHSCFRPFQLLKLWQKGPISISKGQAEKEDFNFEKRLCEQNFVGREFSANFTSGSSVFFFRIQHCHKSCENGDHSKYAIFYANTFAEQHPHLRRLLIFCTAACCSQREDVCLHQTRFSSVSDTDRLEFRQVSSAH